MSMQSFDQLFNQFCACTANFTDRRIGKNTQYSMQDIALGAFSVFFTQCPSFLAHQKAMQHNNSESNAQTIFKMKDIPTDNHIRNTLDNVAPEELFPIYKDIYEALRERGVLDSFKSVNQTTCIALDGTWYYSSDKLHCENCSTIKHSNGTTTYYHSAVTPVIVAPNQKHAIALCPEFVTPQDGHAKQDCEIAASKRWLDKQVTSYLSTLSNNITFLGDDLYSHTPFCRRVLLNNCHFIFTCKPDSHTYLFDWINQLEAGHDVRTVNMRVKNEGHWENHTYRYANVVPLAETEGALNVNWCEVTITDNKGKEKYHNTFVTDWKIDDKNVGGIVIAGRSRWNIENDNNNTLKTKGYHLEHNFGHGKKHLSSLLAAMNMLARLMHTFLNYCDEHYSLIRSVLPSRKTFFEHIRALTLYIRFASWNALMDFMMRGLEIGPYTKHTLNE